MKKLLLFAFSLSLCTAGHGALVVGGFGTTRAAEASIAEGPFTEELRESVVNAFPGSRFVGLDTLTPAALNTVDFLIVGAPTFSSPVLLAASEQTALFNFVKAGGSALVYVDNDSYAGVPISDDANESFLDPFGIDSTGRVPNAATATSVAPNHPVMNGAVWHGNNVCHKLWRLV